MSNDDRLMRIEDTQTDMQKRMAVLETRTADIHCWLAPSKDRGSVPERLARVETRQAGMVRVLWVVVSAVVGSGFAWLGGKLGW